MKPLFSLMEQSSKQLVRNIFKYSLLLAGSFVISLLLLKPVWVKHTGAVHTVMELICIIIAASSFIIVWFRYDRNTARNRVFAYGFLIVAVFDFLHTYYFVSLGLYPEGYYDLSTRFSVIGRLTEVTILALMTTDIKDFNINRWIGLIAALAYSAGVSYLIFTYQNIIPELLTHTGVTSPRVAVEIVIILLTVIALWSLRSMLSRRDTIAYNHLALTLLLLIPNSICFSVYKSSTSFTLIYGHVLKVLYYYYISKGIIETGINYPYIKLEQANRRLEDILDAIPTAILTYDEHMRVNFVNKRFEELFHCKKSSITGLSDKDILKLIPRVGNTEENTLPYRLINNEGDTNDVIRTYKNMAGENIKLLINAYKIENGIMILYSDIKQEQVIENLNLQTQTILNAMIAPAIIMDIEGSITNCNIAFEKLIGADRDKIIGIRNDNLNEMVQFSGKNNKGNFQRGYLKEEAYEASLVSLSGERKEIIGYVSPIHNIDNEIIGVISVMQDVTEMREHQRKLVNQEKLALLGQMGAAIVHETRNFLTTIKGSSQLIELYSEEERVRQYARKINSDTDEVNRIISDFLTLSKPRQAVMAEVSVNDLIISMKSTLETSSLLKGVDVVFTLYHDERYVLCDEAQMKQIILNICKNAVDAMSESKNPVLMIQTGLSEGDCGVFIKITDNGHGILKENLEKIGTPFFTTKSSGTGLGLNVCYQIIRDHNGRLEVESEQGKGTTFTITLPFIADDDYEGESAV